MRWREDERAHLQRMAEWCERNGREVPKALREMPLLVTAEEHEAWTAFLELSSARSVGFAANPIAPGDVLAWCRLNLMPAWRRGWLWRMVRALDDKWRELSEAKHAKPEPGGGQPAGGRGRAAGQAGAR